MSGQILMGTSKLPHTEALAFSGIVAAALTALTSKAVSVSREYMPGHPLAGAVPVCMLTALLDAW